MKYLGLILVLQIIVSCETFNVLDGAGTHGSLATYHYNVSKDSLEQVVNSFIKNEPTIERLKTDGGEDTYVKIVIHSPNFKYYLFRYGGDENYWNTHPSESLIFITATKSVDTEYKSEGEIGRKEQKEAIRIFEKYFINKIGEQKKLKPLER